MSTPLSCYLNTGYSIINENFGIWTLEVLGQLQEQENITRTDLRQLRWDDTDPLEVKYCNIYNEEMNCLDDIKLEEFDESNISIENNLVDVTSDQPPLQTSSILRTLLTGRETDKDHEVAQQETSSSVVCIVCRKSFTDAWTLRIHQRRVHKVTTDGKEKKNRTYLCEVCGKVCTGKLTLQDHYNFIHAGTKPYTCSQCTKSFSTHKYLVVHQRIHSGEKPYACKHCGKSFTHRCTLMIHVRGHTGERPYVCHKCKNSFASKTVLNKHLKICAV